MILTAEASGLSTVPFDELYIQVREADLCEILPGMGPLPAVTSVDSPHDSWDTPGHTRVLTLSDGNTLEETLLTIEADRFTYQVSELTGPLSLLVSSMDGVWSFEAQGEHIRVRWHYTFNLTGWWAWGPSWLIIRGMWERYMQRVVTAAIDHRTPVVNPPQRHTAL